MTTTVSQEARGARVARYLSNEKAARESLATYPEATRQRLEAWQTEQHEWFSDTILEIVAEFITIDDAIRQSAERGGAWRPIETAPKDGTRFWGFWPVDDEVGQQQVTYFDQFTLPLPRFCDLADHIDWTQPTAWQPLPSAPERQR